MQVEVVSTVERPDKVYEDTLCVVDQGPDAPFYAAVFDGRRAWKEGGDAVELVRALGAESTGQASAQFAREFFQKQFQSAGDFSPAAILNGANEQWGQQVLKKFGYSLASPEHLPGCAATVIRIDQERRILKFAHWCDTRIILFSADGTFFIPTIDNMDRWDRILFKLACENARKLGVSPRVALYEVDYGKYPELINPIELDLRHRGLENLNKDAGIGVLNGMQQAAEFMQVGEIPLGGYEYLLLATDGLSFPTAVEEPYDWRSMVKFLLEHDMSMEALVDEIRRMEDSDREFERYPRCTYHRDITGVLLRLKR